MSSEPADGRPAVLFPSQPADPRVVAPFAALVHGGQARRLWMGQSLTVEPHQTFAFLAGAGLRVPMGTSVTLLPLRHPFEAALQARSVAALTGRPFVAGFGVSHPGFVRSLRAEPYASPRGAVREYLGLVRALLRGADLDHAGEGHILRTGLPTIEHPPVELGVGVLRPGMARTAGGVADVAITWMTPPAYVADHLVPALAAGAADEAEREGPADGVRTDSTPPRIVTVVHAAVQRPGRDPAALALTAAGAHLSLPHYTDMLRRAGVKADAADPASGAAELVRRGVFHYGAPDEIAEQLAAYAAAGVDEVVLNPLGVLLTDGLDAAIADVQEILAAAEAHRAR